MENRIIEVKYKCQQGAEDLFYSPETKRVYARQRANVDDIVFWCTTSKWSQGYEADCPIREGITMKVLDYKNRTCFEETLVADTWSGGTSAKRTGPFSDEVLNVFEREIKQEHCLKTYEQWKEWLCSSQEQFGYTGYKDNWMYWETKKESSTILKAFDFFDGPVYLYKEVMVHKICGKRWIEYEIRRKGEDSTMVLCGYEFEE